MEPSSQIAEISFEWLRGQSPLIDDEDDGDDDSLSSLNT